MLACPSHILRPISATRSAGMESVFEEGMEGKMQTAGLDAVIAARRTRADNWCMETDTMHSVIARRNVLLALWAGRKMGLNGSEMSRYAGAVHFSDYEVAGDKDIVCKVCGDLGVLGIEVDEAEVRRKLSEFHKEALRQTNATD